VTRGAAHADTLHNVPEPDTQQLLVYRFNPGAQFEGRLVGALERLESGGALRVLDVLFIANDAETGEINAISAGRRGGGGLVAPLLDFRLDAAARRRATARALEDRAAIPAAVVRDLADKLEPGCAIAAVLVDHVWRRTLDDAVSRTGGTVMVSQFTDATTLSQLGPLLDNDTSA
jgi:hypothetical protein